MLSISCKASIKAVVHLASQVESGKKSSIKEIAELINENEHTVGKLLQKLVKDGIINSNKGPTGGFYISAKQKNQPIINIIRSIDGQDVFKKCGLGFSKCSEKHPCPFHDDYKLIRDLFKKKCEENQVDNFYEKVRGGLAHLVG
ncbi:MAG: Rrf2 family transcriptional regulator [Bacteroidetes bacterium]|nr:Rrf2 family transcriptional regulator [Bacteroidota bacterium]